MRGRKLIFAKGYGWADRESGVAPSGRTVYPIASLSKQFTAAAVMKLVERGRVSLDEPVAKYLPEGSSQKPDSLSESFGSGERFARTAAAFGELGVAVPKRAA